MAKTIKIFKSFEEQDKYNLEQMIATTPLEMVQESLQDAKKISTC